jgi:hypothetical protein
VRTAASANNPAPTNRLGAKSVGPPKLPGTTSSSTRRIGKPPTTSPAPSPANSKAGNHCTAAIASPASTATRRKRHCRMPIAIAITSPSTSAARTPPRPAAPIASASTIVARRLSPGRVAWASQVALAPIHGRCEIAGSAPRTTRLANSPPAIASSATTTTAGSLAGVPRDVRRRAHTAMPSAAHARCRIMVRSSARDELAIHSGGYSAPCDGSAASGTPSPLPSHQPGNAPPCTASAAAMRAGATCV